MKLIQIILGVLIFTGSAFAQVPGPVAATNGTPGLVPKYSTPIQGTPVLVPSKIGDSGSGITYNGTPINAGTVSAVSVVTANGVSGTVANSTTTPAVTLTLGAITPTSVAAGADIIGGTKFTVSSGCTNSATTGGATGGQIVATSTTCSPVITTGITAPTGYICYAFDLTTPAATVKETAFSATTVTFTGTSLGSTDTILFSCKVF